MIEAELKRAAKDLFAELTDALRDADDVPEKYGLDADWLERYYADEPPAPAVVTPPPPPAPVVAPEQYERPKVKTRRVVRDAEGRIAEVIETEGYGPEPERCAAEAEGDDKDSDPDAVAELIAEILAHVHGDDAEEHFDEAFGHDDEAEHYARTWSAIDHPRGKDGRFIPRNSPEAHAAAKDEVRRALKRKPTPEGLKALTEHLSILTTKQLHDLKKEYGIAASGKDVGALRDKIAARLHAGRRKPSVLDSPGKGSPAGAVLPADVVPHKPLGPPPQPDQPAPLPPQREWSKPPLTGKGKEEKPEAPEESRKVHSPAFIKEKIRNAIAERPSRMNHGDTGNNAFMVYDDGRVLSWDDPERRNLRGGHMVHSHSGDLAKPGDPDLDFQPHNSADVKILLDGLKNGDKTASSVIMRDGRMETLRLSPDATPEQKKALANLKPKQLKIDLDPTYEEARKAWKERGIKGHELARENLAAFAKHYGLEYTISSWNAQDAAGAAAPARKPPSAPPAEPEKPPAPGATHLPSGNAPEPTPEPLPASGAAPDADPKAYVHELLSGLGANPPEGQSRRSGNGMTAREVASLMPEPLPSPGGAKEPWQQTLTEHMQQKGHTPAMIERVVGARQSGKFRVDPNTGSTVSAPHSSYATHHAAVKAALAAGKPVPQEVLNDYPDLARQT